MGSDRRREFRRCHNQVDRMGRTPRQRQPHQSHSRLQMGRPLAKQMQSRRSERSFAVRAQNANTLSIPTDKVVVRWLDHSGQYGRTTFGGDGAEADAVILSQLTGKPVRVQWTLQEDLAWSSVSPAYVLDLKAALDPNGHVIAFRSASYTPHQSDARLLGAILAGMPSCLPRPGSWVATESPFSAWSYDKIPTRLEEAYGMPNLAAESASGGLRGNIMRTPGQRQQNFALEGLMNEAA